MTAEETQSAIKSLRTMPNVGPSVAKDLILLGITQPSDLIGRDPLELYRRLESLTRSRQDPCVLDTLMSAVHFAQTGESRTWWSFTADRKALLSAER